MPKLCQHEDCKYPVFGKGFCKFHQKFRTDKKAKKSINKVSDKRWEELQVYKAKRAEYLMANPNCEARINSNCKVSACEIHHRKGKLGGLLYDSTYFLAVCRDCHTYIELHPIEAKEKGFSLERHQ